jgi:hypothetical protein
MKKSVKSLPNGCNKLQTIVTSILEDKLWLFDVNLTLFGWKRKPKERYERKTINATHLSFLLWAVAKYI